MYEHISYDTLVCIGFSQQKATEIWSRWNNWPVGPSEPIREIDPDSNAHLVMTFEDFFTGGLDCGSAIRNQVWQDDDQAWRNCMNRLGVNTATQDAIMASEFKYLRLSNSCLHWTRATVVDRYRAIEEISHKRSGELLLTTQNLRTIEGSIEIFVPGSTVLYKAVPRARLRNVKFDDNGNPTGLIPLSHYDIDPNDMSTWDSGHRLSLNVDYKVAQRQAAYMTHRLGKDTATIVRFVVPNHIIDTLAGTPQLQRVSWPSPDWKALTYHVKNGKRLTNDLKKYARAILCIADVSYGAAGKFKQLKSWENIDEDCVMKVEGLHSNRKAVHYVFELDRLDDEEEPLDKCLDGITIHAYGNSSESPRGQPRTGGA